VLNHEVDKDNVAEVIKAFDPYRPVDWV